MARLLPALNVCLGLHLFFCLGAAMAVDGLGCTAAAASPPACLPPGLAPHTSPPRLRPPLCCTQNGVCITVVDITDHLLGALDRQVDGWGG